LDKAQVPAPNNRNSASPEYRMQDKRGEGVVHVFYLTNTATIQNFQEAATAIRTISNLRWAFTYNASRALVIRGTAEQIAFAGWLTGQLDAPAPPASSSPDYLLPRTGGGFTGAGYDTVARVFHSSPAATLQDLQELATAIRTITDLRLAFTYSPSRILLVRGTADQIELAEWTLQQLDKPAIGPSTVQASSSSASYEFNTSYDRDNIVRVFYLPQTATIPEFQQVATRIRTTANFRRAFTYNAPRAMVVRGTIDQVATAERMVNDLNRPPQN
jgi:hypothetical protein